MLKTFNTFDFNLNSHNNNHIFIMFLRIYIYFFNIHISYRVLLFSKYIYRHIKYVSYLMYYHICII